MQWSYAPLFVRALKKIPHVMCYERTQHTERNASKIRILYRKFVSRWIDAIDCNGSLTGDYVISLGFDKNRLTFGHMVADTEGMSKSIAEIDHKEVIELRKKLCIKEVMILYVGQLIPLKGVQEMLSAWKEFKKGKASNATLVYVGYGKLEKEMRQRIQKENIPDVVITGGVDYDKISIYYKAADCFIIPTTEDNWSLVVPEAMACGLPIASSIYNGCYPELITPNNGWTFDSLNQNDIINTFDKIISSKSLLPTMGEESKRIISTHTAENAAESIMKAINIAQKHCKR